MCLPDLFYVYRCTSSVFVLYIYSAILLSHFVFFIFYFFILFFIFFKVLNSSYSTKLVYSTLLSQNSLFHIQFFWVVFLYIFFFGLSFSIFFSLHTILSKNTWFFTQKQKQKLRKKTFFIPYVWGSLQFFLKL